MVSATLVAIGTFEFQLPVNLATCTLSMANANGVNM